MIIFGRTRNLLAGNKITRCFGIKNYIPVYDRVGECYSREKGFYQGKVYAENRGKGYWTGYLSRQPVSWAIAKVRRARQGQQDFFQKIFQENGEK